MLFHDHRVPAATQSTIPAFCLSCKSVFRDSHHKVSFLKSSNITNKATRISFKQETKTLYNWKPFKPLLTRRNTEEVLRFLLLAAATHTTIQTPKHPCNLKKGEVDHKHGGLGPSWPKHDTRTPSQERISSSKVLRKKFKNLQKNPKTCRIPSRSIQTEQTAPIKQPGSADQLEKRTTEEHLDSKDTERHIFRASPDEGALHI